MTLYITGGHLTPALAVIDEIIKRNDPVTIRFIGREFSQTKTAQSSHERREIERRALPFIPVTASKFHRTHIGQNFFELMKFPISLVQVIQEFRKQKPDVVLSFGGYLAFPVCLLGKLFGARVITHEQTKVAGLANQIIGFFADTIALAHSESAQYFPAGKTIVTGNPIREVLFREYKTPPNWFTDGYKSKPLLYITGGSQGSHIINQTITALLPKLVTQYYVVHQCGVSVDSSTLKDLLHEREKLPIEFQDNYQVREWIEEREVSFLFRNARFVICRAGANTVMELTLTGTPAIFIPLAFAYNDEQQKNASSLVSAGGAILLMQKDLFPETLADAIAEMEMHYDSYKLAMRHESEGLIKNGANQLRKLIID